MFEYYIYFLVIYFIIDMIWISLTSRFHKSAIEGVQKEPLAINMVSGTIYYILVSFLMIYIISQYAKSVDDAMKLGTIIALLMFVTFDLTNKTVFKNYPYWYVAMDVAGGVTSIVLSLYIATKLKFHQ